MKRYLPVKSPLVLDFSVAYKPDPIEERCDQGSRSHFKSVFLPIVLVAAGFIGYLAKEIALPVKTDSDPNDNVRTDWTRKLSTANDNADTERTRIPKPYRYTVNAGDTLYKIAKLFGTDIKSIQNYNYEVDDIDRIVTGQIINIPVKSDQ